MSDWAHAEKNRQSLPSWQWTLCARNGKITSCRGMRVSLVECKVFDFRRRTFGHLIFSCITGTYLKSSTSFLSSIPSPSLPSFPPPPTRRPPLPHPPFPPFLVLLVLLPTVLSSSSFFYFFCVSLSYFFSFSFYFCSSICFSFFSLLLIFFCSIVYDDTESDDVSCLHAVLSLQLTTTS